MVRKDFSEALSVTFLSNTLSDFPRYSVRFSWSSVSDDLFFLSSVFLLFWFSFLLYLFRVLSSAFLSALSSCMEGSK